MTNWSSKTDNRLGHVRAAKVGVCGDSQPVPTCQVVSPKTQAGMVSFVCPHLEVAEHILDSAAVTAKVLIAPSCHHHSLHGPMSQLCHFRETPQSKRTPTCSYLWLLGYSCNAVSILKPTKSNGGLLDLEDVCQVRQAPGIVARRTPLSKETWSLTKLSATWPLTRLLSMAWIEGYIAEQILWAKHQHKNTCSSALSSEQILVIFTLYVRRSKLNSCGEVMASLHKAPYRYTQSQHPFHQLGRIAARRGGSRWGIGFLFPLRWYLQGNSNFYLITKADVDSFS